MEHIIFHNIMTHLDSNKMLVDYQHGFRQKYSCEQTQLIKTLEEISKNLDGNDGGTQTDLIILDFSKAFNSVPHQRLNKLEYYGIRDDTSKWIKHWLTSREQCVLVNGCRNSPEVTGKPVIRCPPRELYSGR